MRLRVGSPAPDEAVHPAIGRAVPAVNGFTTPPVSVSSSPTALCGAVGQGRGGDFAGCADRGFRNGGVGAGQFRGGEGEDKGNRREKTLMSGHNKWSSIKHKKAAADAKRGKIFSTLSKEITLAAREGGGDLELNPRLRTAVAAARAANMPNDNVQRAIKKGTGELGGGPLEELSYEGYAPGGVAVLVNCLSDNRNRTAANVRTCFTRHNSNLASTGAVGWLFQRKARFVVSGPNLDEDKLLELLLEGGVDVEDVTALGDGIEILAPPEAFAQVAQVLDEAGIAIRESGQTMTPENTVELTDPKTARQVVRLIEALEEDEDVQEVFTNFEMSDELMEQLADE